MRLFRTETPLQSNNYQKLYKDTIEQKQSLKSLYFKFQKKQQQR